MKAINKEFFMEIKKTKSRFISIMLIVALGVAFYTGVCSTEPDMRLSADRYYDDGNLMDIRVMSDRGITKEDIDKIKSVEGVKSAEGAHLGDYLNVVDDRESVLSVQSYTKAINNPIIKEGDIPENTNECMVEAAYADTRKIKVGDVITIESGNEIPVEMTLKNNEFKVTGIYYSAYYIGTDRGTTTIGNGKTDGVMMVAEEVFLQPEYTMCYVTIDGAKEKFAYTDEYDELVEKVSDRLEKTLIEKNSKTVREKQYFVLDRSSIQTYMEFDQDAERIGNIGKVVPLIFFIVAALVSLTTMTRMVEEQRTQIGTLKALGYKKTEIAKKYIGYAMLATITGSVAGGLLGSQILPRVIINAYNILYNIMDVCTPINMTYFAIACGLAVGLVLSATIFSCYNELMECPASLMRPEPPKKTKKIWLEHIGFLWKRLNFSQKSTLRNLFRYKKRLFMTLFGISGCMALLTIGFGLKDSINAVISVHYGEVHTYDIVLSLDGNISDEGRQALNNILDNEKRIKKYVPVKQSSVKFENEDESVAGYVYVTEEKEAFDGFIKLRDRKTGKSYELSDEGIMISEKTANMLNVEEGDSITLAVSETEKYEAKINKIVENYVYHNVYITKEYYGKVFGKEKGSEYSSNEVLIKLTDNGKAEEEKLVEGLLQTEGVRGATYIDKTRSRFENMLDSLDIITIVIIIAAGGLAFIVLYNLNNININERRRELATLKVLGFYDAEVSEYIYRENVIITIFGILIGVVLGDILHSFVITTAEVDMVMFGRDVKLISYVKCAFITTMFAILINLSMHFKIKKVDMATSLKSVE